MNIKITHLVALVGAATLYSSCAPVALIPPTVTAPGVNLGSVRVLPTGYKTVRVSGVPYYTHAGKYWKYRNGAYVRVPRPNTVAITPSGIRVLPRGHKVVHIRGKKYYRWGGKHYVRRAGRYVVVRP